MNTAQQTLFGDAPPVAQPPRQTFIDVALDNADAIFREKYTAFLLNCAEWKADFIAEEITDLYRAAKNPAPKEWRAVGGIYQGLVHKGLLEKTGEYRERNQGSPSAVYRLKK